MKTGMSVEFNAHVKCYATFHIVDDIIKEKRVKSNHKDNQTRIINKKIISKSKSPQDGE